MKSSYTPVAWVYREVIADEMARQSQGKVFYFDDDAVAEARGKIVQLEEIGGQGWFIELDNKEKIRIDRIITLFGKPGAAFDEYDAYANACLDCLGGYTREELDDPD